MLPSNGTREVLLADGTSSIQYARFLSGLSRENSVARQLTIKKGHLLVAFSKIMNDFVFSCICKSCLQNTEK